MKKLSNRIELVELNVTELCNRTCWFCPRHDSNVYPNQNKHMSIETFEYVLKALKQSEYTGDITISGFSEPLLCKNLFKGLEILSNHYPIEIITNFDKLTVEILERLDSFNLKLLKIDLYDGIHQLNKLNDMLSKSNYKNEILIKKVYDQSESDLEFYNRGGTAPFDSSYGIDVNRPCHIPFYKAMIDWQGNYMLCHSDWHRESDISVKYDYNVKNMSLEQYLKSEGYVEFVKNMVVSKRKGLTPCEKCDIGGISKGHLWSHV